MQHEAKGKVAQNVLGNEQGQGIIAVFKELGKLSWESFASSRLPLLKLPPDILSALRACKIEYTKAQSIARVKDIEQRQPLLEDARFWKKFAVYSRATAALARFLNDCLFNQDLECRDLEVEWGEWNEPENWENGYCGDDLPEDDTRD